MVLLTVCTGVDSADVRLFCMFVASRHVSSLYLLGIIKLSKTWVHLTVSLNAHLIEYGI